MTLMFPVFGFAAVGLLILVLRWGSAERGGSLVRRVDPAPAPKESFGLLVEVWTGRRQEDGRQVLGRLSATGIRATFGRTPQGWTVYVWPRDRDEALRCLARRP